MSGISGLKVPINTRCRITTLIDNPPIPCIASCVPCRVMLVAVATNIIGYTVLYYLLSAVKAALAVIYSQEVGSSGCCVTVSRRS